MGVTGHSDLDEKSSSATQKKGNRGDDEKGPTNQGSWDQGHQPELGNPSLHGDEARPDRKKQFSGVPSSRERADTGERMIYSTDDGGNSLNKGRVRGPGRGFEAKNRQGQD